MSMPARTPSLARQIAGGVLDADLAALTWILLEDGVPVQVASDERVLRDDLLAALIAALPAHRRPDPSAPSAERRLVRVAGTLGTATPAGPLRAALSRTTGQSGLASTIEGSDLADVLAILRRQGLSDDEVSFLGVVLVLGSATLPDAAAGSAQRVVAAHYLRPVARDAGGHVQRLGPAVLVTWDAERGAYDHFEWAIYPELAARTGRRAGDLEREHRERAERLRSNLPEGRA